MGQDALHIELPRQVSENAGSLVLEPLEDVPARDLAALLASCSDLRSLHFFAPRLPPFAALLPRPFPNMREIRVQTMTRMPGSQIAALTHLAPNLRLLETLSHAHSFDEADLGPLTLDCLVMRYEPAVVLEALLIHRWSARTLVLGVTPLTLRALPDFFPGVASLKTIRSLVLTHLPDFDAFALDAGEVLSLLGTLIAACRLHHLMLQGPPTLIAGVLSCAFGAPAGGGIKRLELFFEPVELTAHLQPAVTALTALLGTHIALRALYIFVEPPDADPQIFAVLRPVCRARRIKFVLR